MSNTVFATFVYPDSEKHLSRMLISLSEQTDNDFDIVLFNDGIQNIEEICARFLNKVPTIRPVKGSVAHVRAVGLVQLKIFPKDTL